MRGSPATSGAAAASGKMWRSSNQSSNYAKQVLEQHKKALATGVRPPIQMEDRQPAQDAAANSAAQNSGNPFINGIAPPQAPGAQNAAMNLKNALNVQAEEDARGTAGPGQANAGSGDGSDYPEVATFLNSIALEKYKDRFVENGIEDEETILELNDEHLDALTVPLGHKLKILKRIKMLR